jgi:hypothetical protein
MSQYVFIGDVRKKQYMLTATKFNQSYRVTDMDRLERFINDSFSNEDGIKTNLILFSEKSDDYKGINKHWQNITNYEGNIRDGRDCFKQH